MSKTKIVIALVAIAALTLVLVGLASAQIAPSQSPNNGVLGWIGNCFGYGANQAYDGQYVAPQAPTDGSVPVPAPNQGSYGYGYGYGPCWAR
jgi:hypothetical protein